MIGEQIDDGAGYVAGARVVDKGKKEQTMYRFELWITTSDQTIVNNIQKKFEHCITEGNPKWNDRKQHPNFQFQPHEKKKY